MRMRIRATARSTTTARAVAARAVAARFEFIHCYARKCFNMFCTFYFLRPGFAISSLGSSASRPAKHRKGGCANCASCAFRKLLHYALAAQDLGESVELLYLGFYPLKVFLSL
jgi:hypothetical protein